MLKLSYKNLFVQLADKEITKVDFRKNVGISQGTMTKINQGEPVSFATIISICEYLNCDIGDVISVKEQE